MSIIINFSASQAFVAAIGGDPVRFDRIPAVQSFCQRTGEQLQIVKLVAGEQVSMTEAAAGERTLQQLDALSLPWDVFESHARLEFANAETLQSGRATVNPD